MENNYRVGKLAEALVAANMSGSADPYQVAAKTIRETIEVALRALPHWDPAGDLVIEEAVRGGFQALILADLDTARGAVVTLCELGDMAREIGRDSDDVLKCALRGMAATRRLIPGDQLLRLRKALEASYRGAGDALALYINLNSEGGQGAPYAL